MSTFLLEKYGVALSGVKWDIGQFKLWQSGNDDVILFTPKQPTLARNNDNKRYQASVTQFRAQKDNTYKIIGGGASFVVTTAIQYNAQDFQQVQEQWRREVLGSGQAKTKNPKFIPLNTRKGETMLALPEISGKASKLTQESKEMGTPGGTVSFMADLTSEGAQEWVQGIRQRRGVTGQIVMNYEYLQLLPACLVEVFVHGQKVFKHLSAQLKASYNGFWYGGSLDLQAQWEEMVRNGAITIKQTGLEALPEGAEEIKKNAMNTFINQAFQNMFPLLFAPKPDVKPAEAGNTSGVFGGANFALKWRKETDAMNLNLRMEFGGWSWLKARMDPDIITYLAQLDDSYVNEVNTELSFPAVISVSGDPMVKAAAVSWSASEGHGPEAPVFGADGGVKEYIVTSRKPDQVNLRYKAKVDFTPPNWPVIEDSKSQSVAQGGNAFLIKPSEWVGRVGVYMYVLDDQNKIDLLNSGEENYLVLNVSYEGPHLKQPIKDSAKITSFTPIEFAYPLDPQGRPGKAKFSAFGVIGGKLVRAKEQPVAFDEKSVFVIVGKNGVQLISKEAELPESDPLAEKLLASAAQPIVSITGENGVIIPDSETENPQPQPREVRGTVVGVEYGFHGPALLIANNGGTPRRVRLRNTQEADPFDDTRKVVRVLLDESGEYAERILVELSAYGD